MQSLGLWENVSTPAAPVIDSRASTYLCGSVRQCAEVAELKQDGYVDSYEFARRSDTGIGMNGLGGRFFTGGWSQCSALAM